MTLKQIHESVYLAFLREEGVMFLVKARFAVKELFL